MILLEDRGRGEFFPCNYSAGPHSVRSSREAVAPLRQHRLAGHVVRIYGSRYNLSLRVLIRRIRGRLDFLSSGTLCEESGMSDLILQQLEREWIAGRPVPELRPGDVVRVHLRIREGDKERVQIFQGTVIRIRGSGTGRTFTVRRIAAHGIGVERTFPLYSPRIDHIEVVRHSRVRRARLYYLRERFGKAARLKERLIAAPEAEELPPEEAAEATESQ